MVGWQPNYSNPDFIRMKKEFRRKRRKRMKITLFFILLFFVFTIISYIFISNENFTAAFVKTTTETVQELKAFKTERFDGKIINEYLITETP